MWQFWDKLINSFPLCYRHPNWSFLSNGKHPKLAIWRCRYMYICFISLQKYCMCLLSSTISISQRLLLPWGIGDSNGGFFLIYFSTSLFWAWLYYITWVFVSDFQNCTSENGSISTVTVKGQRNAPVVINVKKGDAKNQCPQQWQFTG